ncbi:hypothetical protein A7K69_15580 [Parageobacillus thermoglucosidasius]|uniref:Uncharacterized protein n=1 Tax=Parageobacillus thermoglucosidasius TaxID=1426 RepID=A0A1B7KM89_PARTM|nr:hypothetical protein A7K69_15580 [Parageobacillus thermoglucosidasius]
MFLKKPPVLKRKKGCESVNFSFLKTKYMFYHGLHRGKEGSECLCFIVKMSSGLRRWYARMRYAAEKARQNLSRLFYACKVPFAFYYVVTVVVDDGAN